jgi:hypothetical protein
VATTTIGTPKTDCSAKQSGESSRSEIHS